MATCKAIIFLLFYIKYLLNCNGAACETLTVVADCQKAEPRCVWRTDACYCGSSAPLDVFFVMDESGSMGSDHFDDERHFVADMITKALSEDSNVAIMKFSSNLRGVYWFWDNQTPKTDAINAVLSTSYNGGGTYMSDALWGVQYIFDLWENDANYNQDYAGYERLLVFLTDGRPTGGKSPCGEVEKTQAVVGAENIIVVGMGKDWSRSSIKCMVTPGYPTKGGKADYSRVLEVDTFTDEAFAAARQAASKFLCPETMSAKLTEVRIEQYSNNPTYHLSRFIEIYNYGQSVIDLAQETLKFAGFMASDSFGAATAGGSCSISIDPNQYLVIYDNSADVPECPNCNCTLSAQQCSEAIYVPCDGTLGTNDCGICNWDTAAATASNEKWTQTIMDYAGDGVLSTATRASLADWPKKVFPGYSTELSSVDLSPGDGGNWEMSCRYQGTPGAPPIKTCDVSCIPQICTSNGDVNATCHASDVCDCTASNHYILTANRQTCVYMPPPMNCTAENRFDSDLDFVVTDISWEEGTAYEPGVRYEVYTSYLEPGTAESYSTNKLIFPPNADMPSSATITVTAFMENDPVNGQVRSKNTTCPITTMAPTKQPTASPTYSNADIDTCTANILDSGNGYKIDVSWSAGYQKDAYDIPPDAEGHYQYFIFGEFIPGDTQTKIEKITTVLAETLSVNTLDLPGNLPDINVVTVYYVNGVLDTTASTNCIINTLVPTRRPTQNPTGTPTSDPTQDPTTDPTQRPTYSPWTLSQCSLHIPSDLSHVIPITFTINRAFDASDRAAFIFNYNTRQEEFLLDDIQSGTALEKTVGIVVVQQDDINQLNFAIELDTFRAHLQYDDYPGNPVPANSVEVPCLFTTDSPTLAPTKNPTTSPTQGPTQRPSVSPSRAPTDVPTTSPTYQGLRLDYPCTATVSGNGENVRVVFVETIFDDSDVGKIYPLSTSIKYVIRVGSQEEILFASVSNSTQTAPVFTLHGNDVFVPGTTEVSIDIDDDLGDASNVPIYCTIETQGPTKAPTTLPPTPFPTTQQPIVRLNLDDIGTWGIDKDCVFDDDLTRRRLQSLDYECIGCPICTVTENSDERFIRIERYPVDFAFDIHVVLEIEYLVDSNGGVMEEDDFDFGHGRTHSKWKKLFRGETVDKYIVGGLEDYTLDISYYLTQEVVDPEADPEPIEYFVVRIVGCSVDESGGATVAIPEELRGDNMPYLCSPGIYQRVIIAVVQLDGDDTFVTSKTGDMPMWVWYPIGFAALAIPFVAYLIWRFYNAKKRADVMEKQRKFELGEAEKQDDVGEFGIIGDHIEANPIATGAAFEVDKGDAIINHQLQIEKMNFETAQVEVEHNIFKQEFGPVQVEKNDMDN